VIGGSWNCGSCGEPLEIRPGLDIVTVYLGEPGLVAAEVTCEGDRCQAPHNVIPIPFMGGEAARCGIYVLTDDTNPDDPVWRAAAEVGAVIGTIGGYELKWHHAIGTTIRRLMGVVWFTSDEQDPVRDAVERWADEVPTELAALFAA
jgi:hypothetical protein